MPAQSQLRLDDFLAYRTVRLADKMSRAVSGIYKTRFGLTIPQWRIIATIAAQPGLSAKHIAGNTAMDKVKVSRAVQQLMSRGLLERVPLPDDGRAYQLLLTDKGTQLYQTIVPLAREWQAQLLAVLSDEERDTLMDAIDKLELALDSSEQRA